MRSWCVNTREWAAFPANSVAQVRSIIDPTTAESAAG
jgi:hypothetical protein